MARRTFGLLGVPSSAGAHWPGQEKAPAAMRAASLVSELASLGIGIEDYGDLPPVRMTPDRRRPQNLGKKQHGQIADGVILFAKYLLRHAHLSHVSYAPVQRRHEASP